MKSKSSAWAFLRPLLLVVAATAAWIALSAVGASADSSPSHDLLPGAAHSAANLTHQAKDELEPAPAGLAGGPATAPASTVASLVPASLRTAAEEVTGLTENVVQSVPAVSEVVPAGEVAAVADPAVGVVDGAVGAVVPLAGAVLEPLDPVLEPVVNAVVLPVVPPEAEPQTVLPVTTDVGAAPVPEPAPGPPPVAELPKTTQGVTNPAQSGAVSQNLGAKSRLQMKLAAATPVLSEAGPDDAPFRAPSEVPPAVPGAAIGGSGPSGGYGPAASAWITAHHFPVPAVGMAAILGQSLTATAPVSFDPGSSPD